LREEGIGFAIQQQELLIRKESVVDSVSPNTVV
jgi:hypothetical protein